jgi:hypothetical protein
MKTFTKFKFTVILTLLVMVSIDGWGQASSLTVNGQTLARKGYNAAGVDKSTTTEARDSVTAGSTTRYYVVPDASANSGYTGILTGTLTSGFKWDVEALSKTGTADTLTSGRAINAVTGFGSFTNYREITWKGAGTLNLTVQEISAAGCGGTPATIPISIVDAPTVAYPIAAGKEDTCFTGTTGSLNIQVTKKFYINYSTPIAGPSAQGIQIRVNITRNNGGTPVTVASSLQVNFTRVSSTSGYFEIPAATEFDYFDTYTITLADISDRISRKGNFWNTATGNTAFTYYVYPVPTTGTIYHLPNM